MSFSQKPIVKEIQKKFSAQDIFKELKYRGQESGYITDWTEMIPRPAQDTIVPVLSVRNKKFKDYNTEEILEAYQAYYGKDDRIDYYEANENWKSFTQKTLTIVKKNRLKENGDYYEIVPKGMLGTLQSFCSEEKFYSNPVLGFCSGYAASNRTIITAAHCILDNKKFLDSIAFVFDFRYESEKVFTNKIPKENVFFGDKIEVHNKSFYEGTDFCIIRVTRDIPDFRVCKTRLTGVVSPNQNLIAVGYPLGTPVKITPHGKVYNNNPNNFFITNLDVYEGNSGGPVFDSASGQVEGIIKGGNEDFKKVLIFNTLKKCTKSVSCPQEIGSQCEGERIIRASAYIGFLLK